MAGGGSAAWDRGRVRVVGLNGSSFGKLLRLL
jgi:hypothetical protein